MITVLDQTLKDGVLSVRLFTAATIEEISRLVAISMLVVNPGDTYIQ